MKMTKKSTLVSTLLIGMAVSAGANAASNATVIWSGIVPSVVADDDIMITGLAGSLTALIGTISPTTVGVFESDPITLEAHINDGDASAPVLGALTQANWTISEATVTFDGMANPAQTVEVSINGSPTLVGDTIAGVETIATTIKQTTDLPEAEVGGTTVQASVTVMADVI
ncbi:hypothetical protein ERW51_08560 [Aliivibrio finisterrensis]|uniref:hypothetical protein n=1 Tax=Aliivibrio finisterrensis TaxID=511998 RepID=UPI00101F3C32|nr:hypothetical protein [Aliivibrio finisterrensis]RYU68410.1 hypothetical protein ERW54_08755 [Aliivibrio finisterrensis]RYU72162.1 hypothetical protein ERW51_08560 [Aliivibrio finisterrensis]RYU75678.1 hypothetical protein ERW48_07505 [Aliivibrio finisterrensis]